MFKRIFLVLLLAGSSLSAKMIYDPVTNIIYSLPKSPLIDEAEYLELFMVCAQIEKNIDAINVNNPLFDRKTYIKQYKRYLKKIGTPTALRLLEDLKHGVVYYPDGSVARYWSWY